MVAAAIPDGNRSCSMLIICRLAGTARNTPSIETTPTHTISTPVPGTASGRSIISAGIAFTTPAPVMYPAAEAHEAMALFSRMLNSGKNRGKSLRSAEKAANARIAEVIATPSPQPALSPT